MKTLSSPNGKTDYLKYTYKLSNKFIITLFYKISEKKKNK